MDKHKQFTETKHPVGTVLEPASATAVSASPSMSMFKFSEADLSSDFAEIIEPGQKSSTEPVQAPLVDPVKAAPAADSPKASTPVPPQSPTSGKLPPTKRLTKLTGNRYVVIGVIVAVLILLVLGGMFLGKKYMKKAPQAITESTKIDQTTLLVDSEKHSVGVGVDVGSSPDGLEVQAKVSATPQSRANIRMGLINGTDPSILFEDSQKNSWQVLGSGGSFQIIQGTQTRAKLDDKALSLTNALNVGSDANVAGGLKVTGNTTLGNDGGNLLTMQGSKVAIPNNLNFDDNTFFIDAGKGSVAVGAASASGYKLLVAGTVKANGNIYTDGQIFAAPGSAKGPTFAFNNNGNTGIYEPTLNAVGVAAGGSQVLQVQQGSVFTVNGANIEADGYVRAGRGGSNPAFQVARFTGTLDGSGNASISTGLANSNTRVLSVDAFYRGNSNEAMTLNIDAVTGGAIQISGGIPGRQYRVSIVYSSDTAGW